MPADEKAVRLHKLLAAAGVGSRRYCESLIREGRVSVGGRVVGDSVFSALPGEVAVVDGVPVSLIGPEAAAKPGLYIILNKPDRVISSAKDQYGRKTVVDLVRDGIAGRVYPVGRLDYHTRGLILLTNDGDFAYRAAHPKFNVEKAYEVLLDKPPEKSATDRLAEGVVLPDGFRTSRARLYREKNNDRMFTLVLHEGRYRQVRRMAEAVGLNVVGLRRTAIGGLTLGSLAEGEWKALKRREADRIFEPYVRRS